MSQNLNDPFRKPFIYGLNKVIIFCTKKKKLEDKAEAVLQPDNIYVKLRSDKPPSVP